MATHRKWTPEEKMAVVLEGLKGRAIVEICREYGISDVQFYRWRDEALSGMHDALKDKRTKEVRDKSWDVERERMLKKIGEQQLIIDMQKKIFNIP
jgi:transposase-like protein